MRSIGNSSKTITATPRQLESMIRLSESLAKMRLSTAVTAADVTEAVRLIKYALQQAATDPNTGQINMDIITTGTARTPPERLKVVAEFIRNIKVSVQKWQLFFLIQFVFDNFIGRNAISQKGRDQIWQFV